MQSQTLDTHSRVCFLLLALLLFCLGMFLHPMAPNDFVDALINAPLALLSQLRGPPLVLFVLGLTMWAASVLIGVRRRK